MAQLIFRLQSKFLGKENSDFSNKQRKKTRQLFLRTKGNLFKFIGSKLMSTYNKIK